MKFIKINDYRIVSLNEIVSINKSNAFNEGRSKLAINIEYRSEKIVRDFYFETLEERDAMFDKICEKLEA